MAQTQGKTGYLIESSLDNQFMAMGLTIWQPLVSLISYVAASLQPLTIVEKRARSSASSPWALSSFAAAREASR